MKHILLWAFILTLAACAGTVKEEDPAPLKLQPVSFSNLPGWPADTAKDALPALRLSCARILKRPAGMPFSSLKETGTYGDWHEPCRTAQSQSFKTHTQARQFFETHFQPYAVYAGRDPQGLFTGYYEASLNGARQQYGPYQYPLHARPDDLVMVDLGLFREDLKGRRIAGRVQNGRLKPYEDRAQIVSGAWPYQDNVLAWVDDPVDAFFVQIQGSGVITLPNGEIMRIGYAGQNGHPYHAIGRTLIKRGALSKDSVSMQSIRDWLARNPGEATAVMNTNKSYVFFEEKKQNGAIGGEGVVLTPGRSLAVDHSLFPYGMPVWLETAPPAPGEMPLKRLMIAQDTGGAIRGGVRGDVFWGYGPEAERLAGAMKARGRYWILLPR